MPTIKIIPLEEAKQTRKPKEPGVRRQRMNEFDTYAHALLDNPSEAAVYEEIEEAPQKFVLSLRAAFRRAGQVATVRKMRARDEVRAWFEDPASEPTAPKAKRTKRAKELAAV